MNFNKAISDYMVGASPEQMELLEQLRLLIHKSVPQTTEAIKWGFPVFAKTRDYCYLRFSKNHITLGFYHIDKIEDPDNLLEGSGNTLRHIKIKKQEDINEHLLTQWLQAISE